MGRLAKDYEGRELEQDYKFQAILYPDATDYNCEIAVNRLRYYWPHAIWILHDKDCYSPTEVEEWKALHQSDDCHFKEGEIKKKHYHVVAWTDHSPILLGTAASQKFDIPSNYVQRVKNLRKAIQYLIHKNNPDKFQYDVSELQLKDVDEKELRKYLKVDVDMMDKGKRLFDFIQTHDRVTLTQLTTFAFENECYDELRRGQHLYTALLIERNGRYDY